jgi:hypothetical protein
MNKRILILYFILAVSGMPGRGQETLSLPFFDAFEQNISIDNLFENWTTENIEGWQYWHIIRNAGIQGSQCMRFEKTDIPQDDWLITVPILCDEKDSLRISFNYFYLAGPKFPSLCLTTHYSGEAATTSWTEIPLTPDTEEDEWHTMEVVADNPGDTLWLAFHYQAVPDAAMYFLLDNIHILSFNPVIFEKVGSTLYFDGYAQQGQNFNWASVSGHLDAWFGELCSFWDRPGLTPVFPSGKRFRLYLADSAWFRDHQSDPLPDWKCGYSLSDSVLVTKVPGEEDHLYDASYTQVVKNTLAQWILNQHYAGNVEDYFSEGFGLFYCGYQPKRDSILQAMEKLGHQPGLYPLKDLEHFPNTYLKDLITSRIEAQALSTAGIFNCRDGGQLQHWHNHLEYYYNQPEDQRIKLQKQTGHFSIYSADQDIPYLDAIAVKLEEKLARYVDAFAYPVPHGFNCVIYPNSETADKCLIYSDGYNGGSGWSGDKLDILSPIHFSGGLTEALHSLIPHEFFHVFHFNMVIHLFNIPSFHSEGMAEVMAYEEENDSYLARYAGYFRQGLTRFFNENHRYPTLSDVMADRDGYMSVYTYGQAFWHYMHRNHAGYETIRDFFTTGLDWNVFPVSWQEISDGYINYLKTLAGLNGIFDNAEYQEPVFSFHGNELQIRNGNFTGTSSLEIYKLSGQKVMRTNLVCEPGIPLSISVPDLPAKTIYLIRIRAGRQVMAQKIFKSE